MTGRGATIADRNRVVGRNITMAFGKFTGRGSLRQRVHDVGSQDRLAALANRGAGVTQLVRKEQRRAAARRRRHAAEAA